VIQNAYRIIFKSKKNISQALEIIKKEMNSTQDVKMILQFIEKSTQGIVRGYDQKS
jgi:acyl-[acyl carrier protein]--UDP-N-acetylglucosamine O-acyltransferase